jgi:hypothetical protein
MGDTSRRLSAVFATLAIATTALGFVAPPATAAPYTTITNDPAATPTSTAATPSETAVPTSAATVPPTSTPTTEPAVMPARAPAATPEASTKVAELALSEAAAGGPNTTTLSAFYNELSFQPEDTSTAYDRALFEHWINADGNGCDTRQEVLISESQVPVTYGSGCTVTAGQWYSWYDSATWTNPSDVDIDHLVSLQEAWKSGAYRWTPELRKAYANDLGYAHSLEAVTYNVNQPKGAQDPAAWFPSGDMCRYAVNWVSVKWRWNLTVDSSEQAALNGIIYGTGCGSTTVERPSKMDTTGDTFIGWPLYKIVYESTIYELVTQQNGMNQTPIPLSYERWQNVYKFKTPTPASIDFVKYLWSSTVYAVTFWPGGETQWLWTPLSFHQWQNAGYPTPRNAGWIKGSYYYQWGSSSEIFVEGADGVHHKMSYQEWADSGFRPYGQRSNEGYLKLTWAPEFARMPNLSTGAGRPMGYAGWQEEAFPTPRAVQRITGDTFYRDCSSSTIMYAGPGMTARSASRNGRGQVRPAPPSTGPAAAPRPARRT